GPPRQQRDDEQRGRQFEHDAPDAVTLPGRREVLGPRPQGLQQRQGQPYQPAPGATCQPLLRQPAEEQLFDNRGDNDRREHDQDPAEGGCRSLTQFGQGVLFRWGVGPLPAPAGEEVDRQDARRKGDPTQETGEGVSAGVGRDQTQLVRPRAAAGAEQQQDGGHLEWQGQSRNPQGEPGERL